MKLLGNIIWLLFGGILIAMEYLLASLLLFITIIGIPFGIQTLKMARMALWPFGTTLVPNKEAGGCVSVFLNVFWILFAGIGIALTHLTLAVLLFITIIGIPFGLQHVKMARIALLPFGTTLIHKS